METNRGGELVASTVAAPHSKSGQQDDSFYSLDPDAQTALKDMADKFGISTEDLIGIAIRLLIVAEDARSRDQKIVITTQSGRPLAELAPL